MQCVFVLLASLDWTLKKKKWCLPRRGPPGIGLYFLTLSSIAVLAIEDMYYLEEYLTSEDTSGTFRAPDLPGPRSFKIAIANITLDPDSSTVGKHCEPLNPHHNYLAISHWTPIAQ